jgi:cysteine sulfinate desulfinase/cysteine desulfurase-like protein
MNESKRQDFINERLEEAGLTCYYLLGFDSDGGRVMITSEMTEKDNAALQTLLDDFIEANYEGDEDEEEEVWEESD